MGIMWVTNLYNFMDGSDGLAGGMTVFGFSFLGTGAWMSGDDALLIECAIVAAAGAAFLPFNFPPARLFMGDAGSVPIGFLAAVLSLAGWRDGDWPFWFPVAVFSPFIVDATLTLLKRAGARERIWEAHNKHYYQRLVRMGWGHGRTALAEYALMLACGTAALWALREPLYLQLSALLGLVALHAALALWVDSAWRRRENIESV
jgi:UDP-N-acetylmuramyl pentapeptide phosphotransferase/UDP-N-acetylglucosamine-1-phosphate transferase